MVLMPGWFFNILIFVVTKSHNTGKTKRNTTTTTTTKGIRKKKLKQLLQS